MDVVPNEARRYLRAGEFWADYGDLDISNVDPSLLVIPALGTVLPVAYALGVPVRVPLVEANFAAAATELAPIWCDVYSSFSRDGFELIGERVTAAAESAQGSLLLYSGGLDSVASLLANEENVETLLSVWGADVALDDDGLWSNLQSTIDKCTLTSGLRRIVVRSNLRELLDQPRLIHDFLGGPPNDWWGGVQHGMGLLSLAAPVTGTIGLDTVLLAGSHSVDFHVPWGSSPRTDNVVRWGDTRVVHDSFELTRQGKIDKLIAPRVREGGEMLLAVCYQPGRGAEAINCGTCEKCLRTASGLLAAGIDPRSLGLATGVSDLHAWQSRLSAGQRSLDGNEVFMWQDVQRSVDPSAPTLPDVGPYLAWLARFDFTGLSRRPITRRGKLKSEAKYRTKQIARGLPVGIQGRLRRLKRR